MNEKVFLNFISHGFVFIFIYFCKFFPVTLYFCVYIMWWENVTFLKQYYAEMFILWYFPLSSYFHIVIKQHSNWNIVKCERAGWICVCILLKIIFSCMSFNKDRKGIYISYYYIFISLRLWSLHLKCTHWGKKRWKFFFCFPFLTSFSLKKYNFIEKNMYRRSRELLIFPSFIVGIYIEI